MFAPFSRALTFQIYSEKDFLTVSMPLQTTKLFRVLPVANDGNRFMTCIIPITQIYDAYRVPCNICGEFVISPAAVITFSLLLVTVISTAVLNRGKRIRANDHNVSPVVSVLKKTLIRFDWFGSFLRVVEIIWIIWQNCSTSSYVHVVNHKNDKFEISLVICNKATKCTWYAKISRVKYSS